MTRPQTDAEFRGRRKRKVEAEQTRRRGWSDVTFPKAILEDARVLKVQWDPGSKTWIGMKGVQEQLDAIAKVAPDGATHLVVTEDCPYCDRKDCFRLRAWRSLGSAEWGGDLSRCDYCFATTSHHLFEPLERLPGEGPEEYLERCNARIRQRQQEERANGL